MPAGPVTVTSRAARSRSARASAPASCASSASRPTNAVSGGRASRPRGRRARAAATPRPPPRALELDGAERLRPHAGAREAARAGPEQHLAVGGEPFRPAATCSASPVANGRRRVPDASHDSPESTPARTAARARRAGARAPRRGRRRLAELGGGPHGLQRVVLVQALLPEDAHRGVAEVALDRAGRAARSPPRTGPRRGRAARAATRRRGARPARPRP